CRAGAVRWGCLIGGQEPGATECAGRGRQPLRDVGDDPRVCFRPSASERRTTAHGAATSSVPGWIERGRRGELFRPEPTGMARPAGARAGEYSGGTRVDDVEARRR